MIQFCVAPPSSVNCERIPSRAELAVHFCSPLVAVETLPNKRMMPSTFGHRNDIGFKAERK